MAPTPRILLQLKQIASDPVAPLQTTTTKSNLRQFSESIENWSDGISLVLLAIAFIILGLNPKRYLWPSVKRYTYRAIVLTVLIVWTGFRFITEGIFDTIGPREFMAVTIAYVARWLWLAAEPYRRSRSKRWIQTVKELNNLPTVRIGASSRVSRKGEHEVVVRRAVRKVRVDRRRELHKYWRGYEMSVKSTDASYGKRGRINTSWFVELQEENMRKKSLEPLLNDEAWNQTNADFAFYKTVYKEVLDSFPSIVDEEKNDDWCRKFVKLWGLQPPTQMARSADAIDPSTRASIARKIAADALVFVAVPGSDFRMKSQIQLISKLLEKVARQYWKRPGTRKL